MKPIHVIAAALCALAGCSEQVHVSVDCATKETGVECKVAQTEGKSEVEACWDFSVTCGNGAVVTADHTCQKVKDGRTETALIPNAKLHGLDKCAVGEANKPPVAAMTNLTINGKKSE